MEAGSKKTSSALLALRDPVIAILVLAGIFDGISGNPIHSILLLATAAALGRDAVLRRGTPAPARRGPALLDGAIPRIGPLALAAALVYAVVVGGFGRYSWPATAAVVLPGAVVLWLSWQGPVVSRPAVSPVEPVGVWAWASLFVAMALWELAALLLQPSLTTDSYAHPTLSVLTDPILATHPGRSVALFLWLALGWFLMLQ